MGRLEVVRDGATLHALGAGAALERSQANRENLANRMPKPYEFPTSGLIGRARECKYFGLARPERFELPTPWFVARYSIQLSYGRAERKC